VRLFSRLANFVLNLLSVLVLLGVAGILLQRYYSSKKDSSVDVAGALEGTQAKVPGVEWSAHRLSLVFALDTNCIYCRESSTFYKTLASLNEGGLFYSVALLPEPVAESREYLTSLGLSFDDVRRVNLGQLHVRMTPTLLLVDNAGTIRHAWVGKLSTERENEVRQRIGMKSMGERVNAPGEAKAEPNSPQEQQSVISAKELNNEFIHGHRIPIVDLRPRDSYLKGHISDSVNIPPDELEERAPHEVPKGGTVALYCNSCGPCERHLAAQGVPTVCVVGQYILGHMGYSPLKIIRDDFKALKKEGIGFTGSLNEDHVDP